jgi:hypothetical protein
MIELRKDRTVPAARPSTRSRFSEGPFAGVRGNDEIAPEAVSRARVGNGQSAEPLAITSVRNRKGEDARNPLLSGDGPLNGKIT